MSNESLIKFSFGDDTPRAVETVSIAEESEDEEVEIELDSKCDKIIHSGNLMTSQVWKDSRKSRGYNFERFNNDTSMLRYNSLTHLFNCLTLAYRNKLVSPKWKQFRGLSLSIKSKVRLNNLIWRCWHIQFVKNIESLCKFDIPFNHSDDNFYHNPKAVVLEGKYWQREKQLVIKEYIKWRKFHKVKYEVCNCSARYSRNRKGIENEEIEYSASENSSNYKIHDGFAHDDTLFSSTNHAHYPFPHPRDFAAEGYSNIIQPGLAQLQPSLLDNCDMDLDMFTDLFPKIDQAEEKFNSVDFINLFDDMDTSSFVPDITTTRSMSQSQVSSSPWPIGAMSSKEFNNGMTTFDAPASSLSSLPSSPFAHHSYSAPAFLTSDENSVRPFSEPVRLKPSAPVIIKNVNDFRTKLDGFESNHQLIQPSVSNVHSGQTMHSLVGLYNPKGSQLESTPRDSSFKSPQFALPSSKFPELTSLLGYSSKTSSSRTPPSASEIRIFKNESFTNQNSFDSTTRRQKTHLSSEHKRRCNIKVCLEDLQQVVPSLNCAKKVVRISKAATLQKAADYCIQLRKERNDLQVQIDAMEAEVLLARKKLENLQKQLPESGVTCTSRNAETDKAKEEFNKYVKRNTKKNWRFWIFSLIMRPLFESYWENVTVTNLDEFKRTILNWIDNHCSMMCLRTLLTNALTYLSTNTSILSDPSEISEQAVRAVDDISFNC